MKVCQNVRLQNFKWSRINFVCHLMYFIKLYKKLLADLCLVMSLLFVKN